MTEHRSLAQLIADSNLAFINGQNEVSLNLANQAIKFNPNSAEAYKCAGNACLSLERYDDAVTYYKSAVKYDPNNGNRYYDLGYALATLDKLADAMKNFTIAEEMGCSPDNLVQLYNVLGIICFDIGRYDDALINLGKAEQLIGVDMDIMQRKAVIYGMKDDVRNGLLTANQMKLIAPSEYLGYQIAFKLLIQAKRMEAAEKELKRAEKYAVPTIDYYFDTMTLELERFQIDKNKEHFSIALNMIDKALKTIKPTLKSIIECYINAAEINLQLEHPDQVIHCLNAAQNPVGAYNNMFTVAEETFVSTELSAYDVEEMMEADKERNIEEYGTYGLEELVEGVEPDEDGSRAYFTEIDDETDNVERDFTIDETENAEYTKEHIDQINRLYIGAYTLKKDFEKVIDYARVLQASENTQNSYIGKYTEVNALKELDAPNALQKYEKVIKYFRNAMIKDPTDLMAVTFRIQCYIDIENYDEAEQMCNLLTKEIKEPLLDKIHEARSGGEVVNSDIVA